MSRPPCAGLTEVLIWWASSPSTVSLWEHLQYVVFTGTRRRYRKLGFVPHIRAKLGTGIGRGIAPKRGTGTKGEKLNAPPVSPYQLSPVPGGVILAIVTHCCCRCRSDSGWPRLTMRVRRPSSSLSDLHALRRWRRCWGGRRVKERGRQRWGEHRRQQRRGRGMWGGGGNDIHARERTRDGGGCERWEIGGNINLCGSHLLRTKEMLNPEGKK